MERYSEVIGLPVICATDGSKIGTIKDVIFCPKEKSVIAFLLERKGCNIRKKVVLIENILSLGTDALIVNDLSDINELRKVRDMSGFRNKGDVLGLRIYSRSGDDLGIVKDVLFDPKEGKIDGVEVSDGLLQDVIEGRSVLPFLGKVEFSNENILVDNEAVEEMMGTGGGLKNIIEGKKSDI